MGGHRFSLPLSFSGARLPLRHFDDVMSRRQVSDRQDGCGVKLCTRHVEHWSVVYPDLIYLSYLHTSSLDTICSDIDTVSICLMALEIRCRHNTERMPKIRLSKDTFQGAGSFFCSDEGRRVVLGQWACWAKPEMQDVMGSCYRNSVTPAADRGPDNGDMCRELQDFHECVVSEVRRLCNPTAADYVDNLFYRLLTQRLKQATTAA